MHWEKETDPAALRSLLHQVEYFGHPMTLEEAARVRDRIILLEKPVVEETPAPAPKKKIKQ